MITLEMERHCKVGLLYGHCKLRHRTSPYMNMMGIMMKFGYG